MISNQKPKIQEPQKSASQEEQKLKMVHPAPQKNESQKNEPAKQEKTSPVAEQDDRLSEEDRKKSKNADAEEIREV